MSGVRSQRDRLHGIVFKGFKLSIMRPPTYREPHEGDPCRDIKPEELKMPQVSILSKYLHPSGKMISDNFKMSRRAAAGRVLHESIVNQFKHTLRISLCYVF